MLRESGLTDEHAETLYALLIDPANWTPYPDGLIAAPNGAGIAVSH